MKNSVLHYIGATCVSEIKDNVYLNLLCLILVFNFLEVLSIQLHKLTY